MNKEEKEFLQLLSRMNVNNDQVNSVIDLKEKVQKEILKNPYILYESTRLDAVQVPVSIIDKAIFADSKILENFPLPELTQISTSLDKNRIRPYGIQLME
ncbi:hypothetical protein ABID42_004700 [Arcicella rosea]|uniref:hypothetical protein n=1 Tax=Arcicella rosea TaxID=502909 RepID=UPI00345D9BDE